MLTETIPLPHLFAALGDPFRLDAVTRLAGGELTVGALHDPGRMTLSGTMKHLKILEDARLILREKRGRQVWCRLNPQGFRSLKDWTDHYAAFWTGQLDALEAHLRKSEA